MYFSGIKFCMGWSVNDIHDDLFAILNVNNNFVFLCKSAEISNISTANNSHLKVNIHVPSNYILYIELR